MLAVVEVEPLSPSIRDFPASEGALQMVADAVAKASQTVNDARVKAEEGEDKASAVLDAVTLMLSEFKGRVKAAQKGLDRVKTTTRNNWYVAGLIVALLGLQFGFVFALEAISCEMNKSASAAASFSRDCEGASSLAVFICALTLIWACAQLSRAWLLPAAWPRTHTIMSDTKRDKTVGYAIKTSVRFLVLVLLTALIPRLSFDGLVLPFGERDGLPDPCEGEAGFERRLWHISRISFLALMCWELSLLPGLAWDMWVHHLAVIVGVTYSTDHELIIKIWLGGDSPTTVESQEKTTALQGFAFILMYGTAFMFFKELLVLMFQHLKHSYLRKQARLLAAAAIVHVVGQGAFYIVWPFTYLGEVISRGRLPGWPHGFFLISLLMLLNALEAYILYVTVKVMRIKTKKADDADAKRRASRLTVELEPKLPPVAYSDGM